jgi:very-short-patch-repair endonuclease
VLDFYCIKARLAVEIDGRTHETEDRPERDARRDAWLQAQGVEVLRIPARDVLASPDSVADGIVRLALERMKGRAPSTGLRPVPFPRRGGGWLTVPLRCNV